jgi:hypothetical protein
MLRAAIVTSLALSLTALVGCEKKSTTNPEEGDSAGEGDAAEGGDAAGEGGDAAAEGGDGEEPKSEDGGGGW